MNITVRKTELDKISTNILDSAAELNDEIKKLHEVLDKINVAWEGADALEYIDALRFKYVMGLESLTDMIEKYGMYLKNVPEPYLRLDEKFSTDKINI